jgi:hypothetical protein
MSTADEIGLPVDSMEDVETHVIDYLKMIQSKGRPVLSSAALRDHSPPA